MRATFSVISAIALLGVFPQDVTAQTTVDICSRTQQVREKIVAMINDSAQSPPTPPVICSTVAVDQLAAITALNLSGDNIAALQARDFFGLTSLRALELNGNQLNDLPPQIFDALTSLETLDLSSNRLSDLPPKIFDTLASLRELLLSSNRLSDLPPKIFDALTSLETLILSRNQLSDLPPAVFDALTNLETLFLSSNQLKDLPPKVFNTLTNLKYLDLGGLRGNRLSDLPSEIFDALTNLEWLILFNNQLSDLPTAIFDALTSLKGLWLSYNQLSDLPNGIFSGLASLTTLDVGNNPGAPFTLTLTPQTVSDTSFQVVVAQGAPSPMSVTATLSGGTFPDGSNTIRISVQRGRTTSETFVVNPAGNTPVTATLSDPSFLPPDGVARYAGLETAVDPSPLTLQRPTTLNICHRTPQVVRGILHAIPVSQSCSSVSSALLAAITVLDLGDNLAESESKRSQRYRVLAARRFRRP